MTKLLFRRWYFSLPLLLVTLACVAVAAVTVKPDYSSTGHIQFIPPVGTTAKDGTKNPIDNPWYDLGYEALANATVIDVTKKSVLEKMAEEGLSDNITVTTEQVPLFAIEVVGQSAEQATATVQFVQKGIADAVQQRQDALRVAETDTITTLQLDDGTEVEEKTSKTMRVMVVAFGLGLLLTAGVTIGIDALLRWRAGRRREDEGETIAGSAVGSVSPSGHAGTQISSDYASNFEKTQAVLPSAQSGPQQTEPRPSVRPAANGKPSQAPAPVPQQRRAGSDGTYRSQQPTPGNGPDPRLEQAPADATIVLPPWGWKRDEKAERR